MNLSLKIQDRICLITVLAVAVLCGFWALKYGIKHRNQVRLENSLYARSLNKLNRAEASLVQLQTALKASQNQLQVLKARIPQSAEIGMFLKQLDSKIKRRQITLITLQPLPVVKEQFFTKIPIRLVFKGSFADAYRLIYELETMDRMPAAEVLTITKPSIHEPCRVELILNIFEQ